MTIPNSVTNIEDVAFFGCAGLTSVTIPDSVTSIGNLAFACCQRLKELTVDAKNPVYFSTGNCIIEKKGSKTLVAGCINSVIPNDGSVASIGDDAFYGCAGLTSVTIPDGVTTIGNSAFSGCADLTSVTIPNIVTSIGEFAFYDCAGLKSIFIPASVTTIDMEAFSDHTALYGYAGSCAQRWAWENGLAFRSVAEILGDVDGNGKVESSDARLALRAAVHLSNEPTDVKEGSVGYTAADYDKNGKVESSDARCILRVSVKLDPFG